MKLTLIPIRSDETLTIARDGDRLVLNGTPLDLPPEGEERIVEGEPARWIVSALRRGAVSIVVPYGPQIDGKVLPVTTLEVTADGAIALPAQSLHQP